MPNHYKGQGNTPWLCFDTPIPPNLGDGPPDGPASTQYGVSMLTITTPIEPCGPTQCLATPCCGGGGNGPDGGGGGTGPQSREIF